MKNVLFLFLLTVACKSSQKLKNTSLNNIDWNKSIVDIRSALAYIIKAKHIIQILNKLKTIEGSKEFKLQKDIPQTR